MQSTSARQQLTTCQQCDNVVRVDADFCNICGQQLHPHSNKTRSGQFPQRHSLRLNEDEYEDDYEDDDDEEEPSPTHPSATVLIPSSHSEILHTLHHLQDTSASIDAYFPADLPNKAQKLIA